MQTLTSPLDSLVGTDMGNATAKYLGLEKAPWTPEQSAEKVIKMVSKCNLHFGVWDLIRIDRRF